MNNSKLKIFIIIGLLILVSIIGVRYMNKEKPQTQIALSGEEFKSKMQSYDYIVTGPRNYSEDETNYTAYNKSGSIQFEYYKYSDEKGAKESFDFTKSLYKKVAIKFEIEESYKCAIIINDNKYLIVSKVGNTVIMAKTDSKDKETVAEIVNDLGY